MVYRVDQLSTKDLLPPGCRFHPSRASKADHPACVSYQQFNRWFLWYYKVCLICRLANISYAISQESKLWRSLLHRPPTPKVGRLEPGLLVWLQVLGQSSDFYDLHQALHKADVPDTATGLLLTALRNNPVKVPYVPLRWSLSRQIPYTFPCLPTAPFKYCHSFALSGFCSRQAEVNNRFLLRIFSKYPSLFMSPPS